MFKKTESDNGRTEPVIKSSADAAPKPIARSREPATIGPTIRINGDVAGEEDVIVQGRIEGTVTLRENVLVVGKEGQINATVDARIINVEGRMEGDLHGNEQVVVHRSGNVRGNITAPRVTLEDGCKFKGSIDMDVESQAEAKGKSSSAPAAEKVADFKSLTSGGESQSKPGLGKGPGQQVS